jgi:hypothetical protein
MTDKRNNGPSDSPGFVGQMSRLRAHSGATAAELRTFVRQLRGRSPQEVIGTIAQSNLVRSTLLAAGAAVVLLLVFTIVPAMMAKPKPADSPSPATASAPAASKDGSQPAASDAKDGAAKPAPTDVKSTQAGQKDIADKLGIGETKTSDPKKNPLDSTGDDLFKDVK